MELFFRYIGTKRRLLLAILLFASVFAASFALYRLPTAAILYPALLCLMAGSAMLLIGFFRTRNKHRELLRLAETPSESMLLPKNADSIPEEDLIAVAEALCSEIKAKDAANEIALRDRTDYYTVWAHQIKTPVSSMKLALANEDTALSRRLAYDLLRIQQYIDMAMVFLRLDGGGDYVFRGYDLDAVIRPSLRKFAPEFIGRRLSLRYEPTWLHAVTDEKWFSFIFEQLLSNALKYTRTGSVTIDAPDSETLRITDTGIGIAPEDLPRIFEKGYTGYNGRINREATGLGLYLCRRISKRLGIELSIASEPEHGTSVSIRFLHDAVRNATAE